MDGGDHRKAREPAEEGADHIGPGAVAVDELESLPADILRQLAADFKNVVAAANHGRDAQGPGLPSEGAVPEADQLGGDGLVQVLEEAQHMGLGPAGVPAADEMNDLHGKYPLVIL